MAGYQRISAYLYQYNGKRREKTIGFVKMECRQEAGWVQLSLKHAYSLDRQPVQVYGIVREGDRDLGIRLGLMTTDNGQGSFTCSGKGTPEGGIPFFRLRGILLETSGAENYVLGMWDGPTFAMEQYRRWAEQKRPSSEAEAPSEEVEQEVVEAVEQESQREEVSSEPQVEVVSEESGEQELKPQIEVVSAEKPEAVQKASPGMESETVQTQEQAASQAPAQSCVWRSSPVWDIFSRRYGKCRPFAEDTGMQCVKIKPADLSHLARGSRILSGNSFLLHGYYRYNHLLLIRIEPEIYQSRIAADGGMLQNGPKYLLGIPGYCQSSERNMAELFGFREFLPASAYPGASEGFGYWCTQVEV